MSQFHKAERKKGKLRLAIAGPAGSGKTYSALLIALGLGGRIAMIDTERGSGELYDHLGEYDACTIHPPFEPKKYVEAIRAAEDLGYDTIIIDSLSHAWVGQGGLLDVHGHIADKTGNSWSAWRQVTPKHNELVDAMLQSKCHIIATMRSKMEYAQVEENGKKQVKKLGMSPIQRDGMEYVFTVFIDLDQQHTATTTKDRTTLFDGQYFVPTVETGRTLLAWLENNGQLAPGAVAQEKPLAGRQQEAVRGDRGKVPVVSAEAAALQRKTAPSPQARPTGETGESSGVAAPQGEEKPAASAGMNDGLKTLFARIGALDLPREGYKRYCYKRYGICSMTEMTPEQIAEQAKILDSLKRPMRLKEFKVVLEGFGGNGQGAGGAVSMNARSLNASATGPAPLPAQTAAGITPAAGGFDLF